MTDNKQLRDAAHRYCNNGWSIIPLGRDKKPLIQSWLPFQESRASHEEVFRWFQQLSGMNLGIVTGAISGIVVVDVENGGSIEGYPKTVTARTGGGGWHLYYKHPGVPVKNSTRIAELTDIRGDGGYVVAPPSISEKGPYTWELAPWEVKMAPYPTEIIDSKRTVKEKLQGEPPKPSVSERVPVGQRNDTATRYIGTVLTALPRHLWEVAGWGALKEWNVALTESPLPEQELRSVYESIRSRELGKVPEAALKLDTFSLTSLYKQTFPESLWLAQDLIPLGGLTAITGESNTFKTFLTSALAASVATGTPFVGNFGVTGGKILIIDSENHPRISLKRFKDLNVAGTDDIIFIALSELKLDQEQGVVALQKIIDELQPRLVILDSLVRFHSKEENSASEMSQVMNELKKLVSDDRAIVFIHHHKKEQGFGKKGGSQSVRGSSDIFAALDCHISVERHEDYLTIYQNKLRVQPQLEPFNIKIVKSEDQKIAFLYDGTDRSREQQVAAVGDEVLAMLKLATEPLSTKVIKESMDSTSEKLVRAALDMLTTSGEIQMERRGHGAHFYSIAPKKNDEDEELSNEDEPELSEEELLSQIPF